MIAREQPVAFDCAGDSLIGIVHEAAHPAARGVLVVVGGPQYRIGSQRQFLLLARRLAAAGVPTMRFDCRGMGDSDGGFPGFEAIGADIDAALDTFCGAPDGPRDVVLWGLCDGASAILLNAHRDPRVKGVVLVNPWVRTEQGLARAYLWHYYPRRMLQPEFWKKLVGGRFDAGASFKDLAENVRRAKSAATGEAGAGGASVSLALAERMADGLRRFRGPVLLITSGNDLVAQEFEDAAGRSPLWRRLLADPRVARHTLKDADHTFSTASWRDQVADWTLDWIRSW